MTVEQVHKSVEIVNEINKLERELGKIEYVRESCGLMLYIPSCDLSNDTKYIKLTKDEFMFIQQYMSKTLRSKIEKLKTQLAKI